MPNISTFMGLTNCGSKLVKLNFLYSDFRLELNLSLIVASLTVSFSLI